MNRWGYVGSSEYVLQPGDADRQWRTYTDIWRDLKMTRGGLDVLVRSGEVRWVQGESLLKHIAQFPAGGSKAWMFKPDNSIVLAELADGTKVSPGETYYDVGQFIVNDAAARLTGEESPAQRVVEQSGVNISGAGKVKLYAELSRCPNCGAEVPTEQLTPRGCIICAPRRYETFGSGP